MDSNNRNSQSSSSGVTGLRFRKPRLRNNSTASRSRAVGEAIVAATESAGAFLLDSESDDSALLLWLEPGVYTAEVQPGSSGATGTALVEVYQTD